MSVTTDIASVLAALWPREEGGKTEVYALLDGARDRRIEALLSLWALEHASLYGEGIGAELRNAAPFLARLERGREETELLLERAWGCAWGIFAVAPAGTGFRALQRHGKRLLRVLDPGGNVMLFRYYDPRVLRVFVPTCDAVQRAELFGPITRWVMEDPAGAPLVFMAGGRGDAGAGSASRASATARDGS